MMLVHEDGVTLKTARVLAAGLLALTVVLGSASLAGATHARMTHSCVRGNELWFRAGDGTKLVGHRFGGTMPRGRTALVLAHMSVGDLCQWVPYARSLARQGVFVFPFDFRGHGFSEGVEDHRRVAADFVAAVRAVRRLGARKVVVGGASLGGIAALVATPRLSPPVQGVVSVSAPAAISGELDAVPAVRRLRVPTLLVVAEADQNPPYDFATDAQRLYDETATPDKRLVVVPGSLHGSFLVDGSAAVRQLLLSFVRDPRATVRS
jgi:pimeloyl-ACP methyl ester carboxylesterase